MDRLEPGCVSGSGKGHRPQSMMMAQLWFLVREPHLGLRVRLIAKSEPPQFKPRSGGWDPAGECKAAGTPRSLSQKSPLWLKLPSYHS